MLRRVMMAAGSAAAAWTPSNLASLKCWNDADSAATITSSLGKVSRWNDKTANSMDLGQPGAAGLQPDLIAAAQNGRAVVRFNGGHHLFWLLNAASGNDVATAKALFKNVGAACFFILYKKAASDGAATDQALIYFATPTAGFTRVGVWASRAAGSANSLDLIGRRLDADSGQILASANNRGANWTIAVCRIDYANSNASIRINGAEVASTAAFQADGNTSNTDGRDAILGAFTDGGTSLTQIFSGDVAELGMDNVHWTDAEAEKLEGYLAHRWGLTASLPALHPYKSAAPVLP